ncbi:citrulline utilization hydrolase CtlX [Marinomonas flavescens]|uniref:citrulline utilization hydrolase CtlX n=1 Tax=Marinomonas flavescens TaxID=2529379 RepID=UPI001A9FD1B7|nr:arginine deiminase-related protein [Marinomonas flavescens]
MANTMINTITNTITNTQSPEAIVMVRPHCFISNPETMADNAFQYACTSEDAALSAYNEVSAAVASLQEKGVIVHVFEDQSTHTPDSVFPNNWFSTHHNGTLVQYPMYAPNRRNEYRQDIMDFLTTHYGYHSTVNLRGHADQQEFLEGTGSIVFDHQNNIAYAARSNRTSEGLFRHICRDMGYQAVLFDACDEHGVPIYHTNVMMCISAQFVMIGMDMVAEQDRPALFSLFQQSGLTVISLSNQQVRHFCGNAIELRGLNENLLALSHTAFEALTRSQKAIIEESVTLLPLAIPTIESAGGSVRCMIAGIHRSNLAG